MYATFCATTNDAHIVAAMTRAKKRSHHLAGGRLSHLRDSIALFLRQANCKICHVSATHADMFRPLVIWVPVSIIKPCNQPPLHPQPHCIVTEAALSHPDLFLAI